MKIANILNDDDNDVNRAKEMRWEFIGLSVVVVWEAH